ncbi:UNVERIFIED_CONTAM: hypothetical protein PYX00_000435 [Menopon gallinae]|uniref:Protein brambleberry n=1 Tax=Menopon gallinae TaxID=328185 RepID=A0AAW2I8Z5_9NEOP
MPFYIIILGDRCVILIKDGRSEIGKNSPLISVPFEAKTDDEKFLEEAIKLKEIIKSSPLDSCQHKVVLKIKTSCSSMTEEELAKLSVNLLNCQSSVDGRQIFPCTDSMTLKQCTEKMDGTMWNAYHMMNNRARAVCLLARRAQFQALTEMTVNKLTSAAQDQILKLNQMMENQDRLERLTLGTINLIEKGNIEILEQQDAMRISQKGINDFISHNLHELMKEKALIASGHKELSEMTKSIKNRMDEASDQLLMQSEERIIQHKQLLTDIEAVQKLTKEIFERIDMSTDKLLLQHAEAATKYQEAVNNLVKINETVHYLLKLIDTTRNEIDEKFIWMQNFLDDTGIQISKISCIAYHIAYLLIGMLFASFLNLSSLSRVILTLVVPLNLFLTYIDRNDLVLGYDQMTIGLIVSVLSIAIINRLLRPSQPLSSIEYRNINNRTSPEPQKKTSGVNNKFRNFRQFFGKLISSMNNYMPSANHWMSNSRESERDNSYIENYANRSVADGIRDEYPYLSPAFDRTNEVSSHSLVRDWLQNKVPTQSASSGSGNSQKMCSAICRSSRRRCRNMSSRGSEYCYRHLRGQSEMS